MKQTESIYIYENTFTSLLSLIKLLIKNKIKPLDIKNLNYLPTLLDTIVNPKIEEKNIVNFWTSKTSKEIIKTTYYIFLSNNSEKELIIYYFLLNSLKYQNKVFYLRNLNCVNKALKISHQVINEAHKFKGFTRFKELKNHILYAEIAPENDVLDILSNHFKNRLKNEYWIIKDTNHKILSLYDKHNFYIIDNNNFKMDSIEATCENEEIEKLWKNFYKTIGIAERKNDRCRMNFMPKKYWKNMLEMSDEIEKNS